MSGTLAATRLVRAGGHALETIGRLRVELRRDPAAARLDTKARRLQMVCQEMCRLHGFRFELDGRLPDEPAVLVANHLSYVDAPVLAGLTPCLPIAKAELARWPVVGAGARALGVTFVRREDALSGAHALRRALRALAWDVSVLGFPEGTTTPGNQLLPFRRGLFGVARLAGVPVVPIAIAYASPEVAWVGDTWFLPHYLKTAMRRETLVHVRIGAPISPRSRRCAEDLAHAARSRVAALLWRSR